MPAIVLLPSRWSRFWKPLIPGLAALCLFEGLVLRAAEPAVITRIDQCADLMASDTRHTLPVRMTGDVYGVDPLRRCLVLKDDSGFLWLETPGLPADVKLGVRLSISGMAALGQGRVVLGPTPVVESLLSEGEFHRNGRIYLQPGKQPFELRYVQEVAKAVLEVNWAGPGFVFTKIPVDSLWHADPNKPGQWLPGMRFDFFEGDWSGIPELAPLTPVAAGVASDFTARANREGVGLRFALRFTGHLEVPREGYYQFTLCADDSADLFLGVNVPGLMSVIGAATLEEPVRVMPGQPWGGLPDPAWMETEGIVTQAGSESGRTQLELRTDTGRMLVTITEAHSPGDTTLLNNRVRVRGLGQSAEALDGGTVAGLMLVPGLSNLTVLEASPENQLKDLQKFTHVKAIRRLQTTEAERGHPVQFTGVVTFVTEGGMEGCVQSDNEGIYVVAATNTQPLRVGDLCEFEGITSVHNLTPTVTFKRRTVLGRGQFPEPLRPTWNQLRDNRLDAQWAELQGVVLATTGAGINLGIRGGDVMIRINQGGLEDFRKYLHAEVSVRGTLRSLFNKQQFEGSLLDVNSLLDVTVVEPGTDPFVSAPIRRVSDLLQFNPNPGPAHYVKISGQIVHARSPTFYLMDGTNGLRFTTRQSTDLAAGDVVEVVGLAENAGSETTFRQAQARRIKQTPLPSPRPLPLAVAAYEATLVRVEGTLLSTNSSRNDQFLELNDGIRTYRARLSHGHGALPQVPAGSRIEVTGVFARQGIEGQTGEFAPHPELLLNSAADVAVLERPSWWTLRRTLWVLTGMGLLLGAAFAWIAALRQRVERRTRELRQEIVGHQRTEASLQEQTLRLQTEVEERKRTQHEKESIHRQLVEASRRAGQAEVAASVLHNVGNVLNSVNVSAGVLSERLRRMPLPGLSKAAQLMHDHSDDLHSFLTGDAKGRKLPHYLSQLALHLGRDQKELIGELGGLAQHIEHIKEIVAMQQTYARVSGIMEEIPLTQPIESAVKMHADSFSRHSVKIRREFQDVPPVNVDKHRLLQILVNLLRNATLACEESGRADKEVTLRIRRADGSTVNIEVADNGIGIPAENLTRIFSHGFTTRKEGHGFGLHSSALAAREMGGRLTVHSDGPGRGATFALELPLLANAVVEENADPSLLVLAD